MVINGDDEHEHEYDGREAQCDAVKQDHSLQKCKRSCNTAEMKPAWGFNIIDAKIEIAPIGNREKQLCDALALN